MGPAPTVSGCWRRRRSRPCGSRWCHPPGRPQRTVGLAWNIGLHNDVSHGGGTYGQSTFLMFCPDQGIALSVLTNAFVGSELAVDAANWVIERVVGASRPQTPVVPVPGDVLDACAGLYRSPLDTSWSLVGRRGHSSRAGDLRRRFPNATQPPPADAVPPLIRLGFYAEDRLVGLDPPFLETRAELLRGPEGGVGLALRADPIDVNAQQDASIALHRGAVVVPVGMLTGHQPVVADQRLQGAGSDSTLARPSA